MIRFVNYMFFLTAFLTACSRSDLSSYSFGAGGGGITESAGGDGTGIGSCTNAESCPDPILPCMKKECTAEGACSYAQVGGGKSSPVQVPGDCMQIICNDSEQYPHTNVPDLNDGVNCGECSPGETRECFLVPEPIQNIGACTPGTQTCEDGFWGECFNAGIPTEEVCDGMDNDCNGVVDAGIPIVTCPLETQSGCNTDGHTFCFSGVVMCLRVEVCDGIDNDCNGETDENLGMISCGTGQCSQTVPACNDEGVHNTCQPLQPETEVCGDKIDNDCNGIVDDC